MDLRRKRIKKLQQLQKQQSSSSAPTISTQLDEAFLVSEADLIWWVSTRQNTTPSHQLAPTWLKDRLQELAFAQDSSMSASELAKMESAIKALLATSTKSDNTLCEELLDVLGYSDFAMLLIPEIVSNRAALLRAFANKQQQSSPKSFIPGAGLGGGDPTRRTALPTGTTREWNDLKLTPNNAVVGRYELVNVPATPAAPTASEDELIPVSRFGTLAQRAFSGITHLNRVQTRVFHSAYETNENLLIVAPTSAGKTNIAMTCIAREIETKSPLGVKCVYIAPMKALAQEIVEKFSKQLASLHMTVRELTGDTQLTRSEMERTQVIVSTPEKWDVISRKGGDMVEMIHLLIIDEVHLVGDDRGPVVEALVARTIRQVERRQQMVRIVGLSATLPNYADLALFLRVNPDKGLFYFDSSYRPVPLEQKFIGVSLENAPQQPQQQAGGGKPLTQEEKQRMKIQGKAQRTLESAYNEICFDHAAACVEGGDQVLVFVHTRKDTSRTARALLEIASSRRTSSSEVFLTAKQDTAQYQQFARRVAASKNQDLQQLFAQGMGIHHAGMAREDRSLTEEMFTAGVISVLCCTSTLAWGVNLPSHLVIVKGTQIYAPDRGGICELNSADVFQCFGRAGRPQFDTSGEAILITEHTQLSRYLAMLTHTLPLESKLVQGLPDALNAEIVGGTVATVDEAMAWLSYTFFYVRMLKSPMQYGVAFDERKTDPNLDVARGKLISQTLRLLCEAKMVRIGVSSQQSRLGNAIFPGNTPLGTTDLGRVASNYYVSYQTVETLFNERIRKQMSIAELLDAICSSKEFDQLKVREEEQVEVRRLSSQACPFVLEVIEHVRNPFDTPRAKTFVLLQTYISRFPVDAFTLYSDMNYIAQNAGRITRALFEVAVSKAWLPLAMQTMQLSAALERQSWWYPMQHPLRQLAPVHVKPETVAVLENAQDGGDWLVDRLLETSEHGLVQNFAALNAHQAQRLLTACRLLPICKLELMQRQPISAALLRLVVKITPKFTWREKIHGARQSYYLFVDTGDDILHSERVSVSCNNESEQVERTIVVPLFQHRVAQYNVRLENDSGWLDCGTVCTVNISDIQVPRETETQFTDLLPLDPLPITALKNPRVQETLQFSHFNPIQTQCFYALYHGKHSLVISAPTSSGKTVLAELAMWQVLFSTAEKKTIVYVAPMKALVQERIMDWRSRFAHWNKSVVELTGDNSATQQELRNADLIVTTPEKFEVSTRFYHNTPASFLHSVGLVVFDEIHLLGEDRGAALEAIVSRLKRMEQQQQQPVRMIGLSATLANPSDVREWFGARDTVVYNFRSAVRAVPLEVHISGFPGAHYCPRMASMNKPIFHAIQQHATNKPVLVFVASRRQTRLTALDLISLCAATDNPRTFLHAEDFDVDTIQDEAFRHCAQFGIALHHAGLSREDRERAELLFSSGACQVLIATATLAWGVNLPSYLVVIKGTEYFDAKSRTYVPFPVSDVLQMMGRAGRVQYGEEKGVAVLFVHDQLKAFYKRFLYEPFPLESNLVNRFAAFLNVEICAGRVSNVSTALEYLASTFLALRVDKNPLYYGVERNVTTQAYFTKLVRARLEHLVANECCSRDFTPLPLGVIAARFDLEPETIKWMADRVRKETEQSTPSWVLETVTQTKDFDDIVVRANEDELNRTLAQVLEWGAGTYSDLAKPNCKAFLLLQARMQNVKLPIHDYIADTRQVEDIASRALPAFVRVVCALELALQFCLDVLVLIGRLHNTRQSSSQQAKLQVARQGNVVRCSTTGKTESDLWWCLSTADGKHVLAVERTTNNNNITLELPSKWTNTLAKLKVTLVRENGSGVVDSKEIA